MATLIPNGNIRQPASNSAGSAGWPYLVLLGAIGALHGAWLVGGILWLPASPFWQSPPNDIATGLVGMEAALQDTWHWPLALTNRLLASGEPISIAYTDSLPLLAIVLKAIGVNASMLPPFGLAILVSQVLQPIAAGWALRRTGLSHWLILLPGALLLACAPSWLFRLLAQHVTLTWHWQILLALGLSLGWCRTGRPTRGEMAGALLLCFIALCTHVYLALLVVTMLLPVGLMLLGTKRPFGTGLFAAGLFVGGMIASVVAGAIVCGLWPPPKAGLTIGPYMSQPGYYSANLLGPFDFSYSALWTASRPIDATKGQYEGMSYVGAGVLFLLALLVLCTAARLLPPALRATTRHSEPRGAPAVSHFWPVIAAAAALALTALFPTIWLGDERLVSFPVPAVLAQFLDQFRSNGRFIWPALYLLIILSIVATVRSIGARQAGIALTVALGLQVADSAILRQGIRDMIARSAAVPDELAAMSAAGALKGNVRLRPSWACLRIPDFVLDRLISLRVIRAGGIVYEPPIARGGTSDCNPSLIAADHPMPSVADFIFRYSLSLADQIVLMARRDCSAFETLFVCRGERTTGVLSLAQALSLLPPDERVQAGVRYPITQGRPGVEWLSTGWSVPETWGTWSDGPSAVLMLPVPQRPNARVLQLELTAFTGAPSRRQSLSAMIGGRTLWEGDLVASQVQTIRLAVHAETSRSNFVLLILRVGHPQSPDGAGMNNDTRLLGVGLLSIEWQD